MQKAWRSAKIHLSEIQFASGFSSDEDDDEDEEPLRKQKPARRKCCNTHGNGLRPRDFRAKPAPRVVRKWWEGVREEMKELYRQIFIPITVEP